MASKSGSLSRLAPCASSQSTSPWRNRTPLIMTPFGFGIFGSLKSLPRGGRALYRFTVQGYRALAALSSLLLSARLACGGAEGQVSGARCQVSGASRPSVHAGHGQRTTYSRQFSALVRFKSHCHRCRLRSAYCLTPAPSLLTPRSASPLVTRLCLLARRPLPAVNCGKQPPTLVWYLTPNT